MVMLAINLVACGDDKEDGDKEITPSIVGTWKLTVDKGYTHTHVTFTKDGTFSYTSTDTRIVKFAYSSFSGCSIASISFSLPNTFTLR